MINQEIKLLGEQFQKLELHAAQSGRMVLNALIQTAVRSQAENFYQLKADIQENCLYLLPVLPPYAPPINNINKVMLVLESTEVDGSDLEEIKHRLVNLGAADAPKNIHAQIAKHLITIIQERVTVYTHTLSETVIGVLLALHNKEYIKRVYVTESRPNNDGWITAKKLITAGIETYLSLDMEFPSAIDHADLMVSGTEIINPDGSVVCKVGIYPATIYCKMVSKPVYILADTGKISPINSKKLNKTTLSLKSMGISNNTDGLIAFGSYFDTTPSKYITGYASEKGLLNAKDVSLIVKDQPVSMWLDSQLKAMNLD